MIVELTKEEVGVLIQYIDFLDEFDDDPSFREHGFSARKKLLNAGGEKCWKNFLLNATRLRLLD